MVPFLSEWETVKAEEYDDESPLEKRIEGPGDRRVNVDSDPGSPPMEESLGGRGGIPSPPILLPHGRLHHGGIHITLLFISSHSHTRTRTHTHTHTQPCLSSFCLSKVRECHPVEAFP